MVKQCTSWVYDQRNAKLFRKDLMCVTDNKYITVEISEATGPGVFFLLDESGLLIQQLDTIHERIGRAGVDHVNHFSGSLEFNHRGQIT